jgi:hypothetical protein
MLNRMDIISIGYYDDRRAARIPIDRYDLRSAFDQRPQQLRYEVFDGYVVLTEPTERAFARRDV